MRQRDALVAGGDGAEPLAGGVHVGVGPERGLIVIVNRKLLLLLLHLFERPV